MSDTDSSGTERYPDDWADRRKRVLTRDNWQCTKCNNNKRKLHVHHIQPISKGGTHELTNLTTLCSECHGQVHNSEVCEICDLFADVELLEMAESHGGPFHVCDRCFSELNSGSDCGICGSETNGKYSLLELAEGGFSCGICTECRKKTVFRQQYGHIESKLRAERIYRFLQPGTDGGQTDE